jgi:hypothetical protein
LPRRTILVADAVAAVIAVAAVGKKKEAVKRADAKAAIAVNVSHVVDAMAEAGKNPEVVRGRARRKSLRIGREFRFVPGAELLPLRTERVLKPPCKWIQIHNREISRLIRKRSETVFRFNPWEPLTLGLEVRAPVTVLSLPVLPEEKKTSLMKKIGSLISGRKPPKTLL